MQFEYHNPTRLVFGTGSLSRLGEMASQYGKRALLVIGGGSVKRNGTFDRVVKSLSDAGISVFECEGAGPYTVDGSRYRLGIARRSVVH